MLSGGQWDGGERVGRLSRFVGEALIPEFCNEVIPCPVCGSICSDPPLYRYTAQEAATHFCPMTRDAGRYQKLLRCIRRLWQRDDCFILRCRSCSFTFGHPFVGGDEEFYGILHEQKGYPAWRWDYDLAIRKALATFDEGKILDIGAGEGQFLRRLGQKWECYAVESTEVTRSELKRHGIHVFRDLKQATGSLSHTFHVVTLFQVLEHIAEFDWVLTCCRKLLREGGRLVVTVPDAEAMIRQERLTGCPDMPPNHINKWSPNNLSVVLRRVGFEPGPPIFEPPSLTHLKDSLYLHVLSDSKNPQSIAALIYRIKSKALRVPLLASLGIGKLLVRLRYIQELRQGGAFGVVGIAK